jgi:hypothetical protein
MEPNFSFKGKIFGDKLVSSGFINPKTTDYVNDLKIQGEISIVNHIATAKTF